MERKKITEFNVRNTGGSGVGGGGGQNSESYKKEMSNAKTNKSYGQKKRHPNQIDSPILSPVPR
jgi:hypothetical protein